MTDTTIHVPLKKQDILDLNMVLVDKMLDYKRNPDTNMSQEEFNIYHRLVDVFCKSIERVEQR